MTGRRALVVLTRWLITPACLCVIWGLALAGTAGADPSNCTTSGTTTTCTYASTGGEQQFVVPANVASIDVTAVGAPGGTVDDVGLAGQPGLGGYGAVVSGAVAVTPNETIYVEVGGLAQAGYESYEVNPATATAGVGGFNGGGNGAAYPEYTASGGGGGASDIRTVSCGSPCNPESSASLASRVLAAGGGGGGGAGALEENGGNGGSGGMTPASGVNGEDELLQNSDNEHITGTGGGGGGAGTSTQGGTGGAAGAYPDDSSVCLPASAGSSGELGYGGSGNAGDYPQAPGGGGGGGAYGGGGGGSGCWSGNDSGAGGGGGAGSNLVGSSVSGAAISTDTTGTPSVTISYSPAPAPAVTTGGAAVANKSATIQGTVNPEGLPTQYHFEFGRTASYGSSTASVSAGSGTSDVDVSADVTGLKPKTTYHYRLVATNASGTTDGTDQTFTTSHGSSGH